jgi:hypothetical protein
VGLEKKRGVAISRDAPFTSRSGFFAGRRPGCSAHERLWNFLPAIQRRRKFRRALDSLRQSIKAADVEVKQKNFCCDAI